MHIKEHNLKKKRYWSNRPQFLLTANLIILNQVENAFITNSIICQFFDTDADASGFEFQWNNLNKILSMTIEYDILYLSK